MLIQYENINMSVLNEIICSRTKQYAEIRGVFMPSQ